MESGLCVVVVEFEIVFPFLDVVDRYCLGYPISVPTLYGQKGKKKLHN